MWAGSRRGDGSLLVGAWESLSSSVGGKWKLRPSVPPCGGVLLYSVF